MLANAHREILAEVEHDIAVLTDKLRQLQAVASYHASKLGVDNGHAPETPINRLTAREAVHVYSDVSRMFSEGTAASTRFKNANQREAAALILKEAGRPLRAGDIARTLIKGGYPKPTKLGKLTNSLFTSMTRDERRFKKVGVGMWAYVGDKDAAEEPVEEEQER